MTFVDALRKAVAFIGTDGASIDDDEAKAICETLEILATAIDNGDFDDDQL